MKITNVHLPIIFLISLYMPVTLLGTRNSALKKTDGARSYPVRQALNIEADFQHHSTFPSPRSSNTARRVFFDSRGRPIWSQVTLLSLVSGCWRKGLIAQLWIMR